MGTLQNLEKISTTNYFELANSNYNNVQHSDTIIRQIREQDTPQLISFHAPELNFLIFVFFAVSVDIEFSRLKTEKVPGKRWQNLRGRKKDIPAYSSKSGKFAGISKKADCCR